MCCAASCNNGYSKGQLELDKEGKPSMIERMMQCNL